MESVEVEVVKITFPPPYFRTLYSAKQLEDVNVHACGRLGFMTTVSDNSSLVGAANDCVVRRAFVIPDVDAIDSHNSLYAFVCMPAFHADLGL